MKKSLAIAAICTAIGFAGGAKYTTEYRYLKVFLSAKINGKTKKIASPKKKVDDDYMEICAHIGTDHFSKPECWADCSINGEIPEPPVR